MNRAFIGMGLVVLLANGFASSSHAGFDIDFAGSIDEQSSCINFAGSGYPAVISEFTVPSNDDYSFIYQSHTWSNSLFTYIVQAPFDPLIPLNSQTSLGFFNSIDPPFDPIALEAGITYYLVTNNNQQFDSPQACLERESTDGGTFVNSSDIPINNPLQITIESGFIKLSTTEGGAPDPYYCSQGAQDYGRMVVDETSNVLYICAVSGWTTATLTPVP